MAETKTTSFKIKEPLKKRLKASAKKQKISLHAYVLKVLESHVK